jgi:hypothetical protein
VVWCDTENAAAINHQRARAWGVPLSDVIVPTVNGDPLSDIDLGGGVGWSEFERCVRQEGVRLAVVDSLGGAFMRENKPEAKRIAKKLASLAQEVQVGMVVIHHPRKLRLGERDEVTLERVRGHSGLVQFARIIWALERPNPHVPEQVRCKMIKSNLGIKPEPFGFEIMEEGLAWTDAPDAPRQKTQLERASELLKMTLKDGPELSSLVYERGREADISEHTLRRAKKDIGVTAMKRGDAWWWSLEGPSDA